MKISDFYICTIVCLFFLGNFTLFAQHDMKNSYVNGADFVVLDSTIVDFTTYPKDSVILFERKAKNYENNLDIKKDKLKLAAIYHYIIHTNLTLNNKQTALIYLYKLLEIKGLKDSKGAIDVYWGIFHLYNSMGNTPGMLEQFDDLKRLGKKYEYYKQTEAYNLDKVYGEILINSRYFDEAKKFYLSKLVKDSLVFDPVRFAIINNDLASVFEDLNKPDSVDIYRQNALRIINSDRPDSYKTGYRSYINNYIKLQDFWYRKILNKETLNFAKNFLKDATSNHKGELHTAVYAHHFIANHYFINKNYKEALQHINNAISIGVRKLTPIKTQDLFNLKLRILDALGETEEAQKTYNRFIFLRDSVNAMTRDISLTRYEIRKVLENQEVIKTLAAENENKYKLAFHSTVFVIILFIICIDFYN